MNTRFDFVCDPPEMNIEVNVSGNHLVARLVLYNKDNLVLSRKFLIRSIDPEKVNESVSVFCELVTCGRLRDKRFTDEEQDTDFKILASVSTLKKVYSKLGLLVWERESC